MRKSLREGEKGAKGSQGQFMSALRGLMVVLALVATGCASVSVVSWSEERELRPPEKAPRPSVGVREIGAIVSQAAGAGSDQTLFLDKATGHVKVNSSLDAGGGGSVLGAIIAESLVKEWGESYGAEREVPTPNGLLVTGQIWEASRGSRLLRTVVGLGAGRSRLEGRFYVYNLAKSETKPWLKIHTEGGSNREPGIMWTFIPGPYAAANIVGLAGVVATACVKAPQGLTGDAGRTGKTLAKFMEDRLSRKVYLREHRAKLSGHYNLPILGAGGIPFSKSRLRMTETLYLE